MKYKDPRTKADRLLLTRELAERLGVEPETVRRWTREGLIPACRIGVKTLRFDLEQVLATISLDRQKRGVGHD